MPFPPYHFSPELNEEALPLESNFRNFRPTEIVNAYPIVIDAQSACRHTHLDFLPGIVPDTVKGDAIRVQPLRMIQIVELRIRRRLPLV